MIPYAQENRALILCDANADSILNTCFHVAMVRLAGGWHGKHSRICFVSMTARACSYINLLILWTIPLFLRRPLQASMYNPEEEYTFDIIGFHYFKYQEPENLLGNPMKVSCTLVNMPWIGKWSLATRLIIADQLSVYPRLFFSRCSKWWSTTWNEDWKTKNTAFHFRILVYIYIYIYKHI